MVEVHLWKERRGLLGDCVWKKLYEENGHGGT